MSWRTAGHGPLFQLAFVVSAIVVVAAVGITLLLVHFGRAADELAAEASLGFFAALHETQADRVAANTGDYSYWDDAVQWMVAHPDAEWWDLNAGAYAVEAFGLSFSMVLAGDDRPTLFAFAEPPPSAAVAGPTPSLRALTAAARANARGREAGSFEAATGLVILAGAPHLAAASVVVPQTAAMTPSPDPDAVLVFARPLSVVLEESAAIMDISDMSLAPPRRGQVSVPLGTHDGTAVGEVSWTPARPGRAMVGAMLPAVLVMLAVVVALVVLFAIRSRWLARRMDADERARHALALRSQSILTAAGDAIFGVDAAGRVIFANPVALGILGFSSEEFLGSDPSALIREQEPLKRVFSRGEPYAVEGGILTRKDGSTFPADCQINPMREEGATTGAVVVFRDITLRKRAEEEMRYLATYDQLTGLPNRGLLVERIGQAVRLARRRRTRVGVLFVDLDHFKPVNDVLGHPFGDQVLVEVGKRLRGCVRESDTVARHGGDEFVVVLDDLGAAEDAARPAQEIVDAVNACIELGDHRIHVGASVGVAVFPDDGVDATALLAHADLAMYRAKASGRNSFRYYAPEMSDEVGQRREMESALREAVDQGHFELHYQPILGLAGGEPVAAEALVRWRRPGLGLVGPDQFIPLAEETGLISDIGLWVLEEACRQQARWRAAGRSTRLSLNLSSRQVPRGLPLERLSEALARHGLAPADLDIEITESLLVDDSAPVREWLEGLRELGLGLVLDDFGTGYSSLDYLRRIPVTAVKIARGFVATLGVEAGGETLVESILAMAHGLGMRVIAEGVETEEQLAWLRAHGCDEAQGFLLARPAAADAVAWPRLIAGPGRSLPLRVVRGEGRGRPVEEAVEEEAEPTRPAAPSARPG